MTTLRERMTSDLRIRNYSPRTIDAYVRQVAQFAEYYGRSPADLGPEQIRGFQVHLVEERGLSWSTLNNTVCALRVFYRVTLRRDWLVDHIPYAKRPKTLPVVLGRDETLRFLDALKHPLHRVILMTTYSAGLRVSEAVSLQVHNIDSDRMLIHVTGKGSKDRYVPLSPLVLELLRAHWKLTRSQRWLFPGQRPDQHLSSRTVQRACRRAAEAAGIGKRVTPHTLRHSFATHLLERNINIRTIQKLLGHKKIETTSLYTHVTSDVLRQTASPLDTLLASSESTE